MVPLTEGRRKKKAEEFKARQLRKERFEARAKEEEVQGGSGEDGGGEFEMRIAPVPL